MTQGIFEKWLNLWRGRQQEIDSAITGRLGEGRSVDDVFPDIRDTTHTWLDTAPDPTDYNQKFREYFDSRIEEMERGGAISRNENGSFYVNPNYAPGEGAANPGTIGNMYAEGAVSSRSSAGSEDPADLI
jgi:hypothetical protein